MAPPRFRGDSDDWMDDEEVTEGAKGSGPRKKVAKAVFLPAEQANATVSEVYPKQCRVRLDGDTHPPEEILCSYRRAGVVGQVDQEYRERTPVAVGDRVLADRHSPDSGVIEGLCERTNRLLRPAPGREGRKMIHVLAANVDIVAIIAPVREPEFSPGLIDRFLIAAAASQPRAIEPILCINKVDLLGVGDPHFWEIYRSFGYCVFEAERLAQKTGKSAVVVEVKTVVRVVRTMTPVMS
jgi:putative ribosome biogenesis GTPase RsgA